MMPTVSPTNQFAIEPTSDGAPPTNVFEAPGVITVGEFRETFWMDLSFWTVDEYRRSWHAALRRLDHAEVVDSCLVASTTDPATANWILCRPLYRRGERVFVQNSLVFLDQLDHEFSADEPWLSISPRRTVNEDGERISEWATTMSAVRRFASVSGV